MKDDSTFRVKGRYINIAFLGNQISWGGGAKSLLLLIKSLRDYDLNMFVFVTNISSASMKSELERYVNSVQLIKVPEVVGAQNETLEENAEIVLEENFDLNAIELFANELLNLKIDILHINNSVFSPVYKIIKTKTSVKIVTHVREWIHWNGIHDKQKYMIQNILQYSDSIICISDNEAEVFINHANLHVIPNPFDFMELKNTNLNKDYVKESNGIAQDCIVVGMMSSFMENKGILDFLKVLDFLKKTYKDIPRLKFIFLGQNLPSRYTRFKALIKSLTGKRSFLIKVYKYVKTNHLIDDVLFLSKRGNVLEYIDCFDIAVRPSYSGDPWGRDIIEYMALRKPVIATGTSDFFIKSGQTGFLVPVHDYQKIADIIYRLSKDEKERNTIGEAAGIMIYEKCNMGCFSNQILNVYNTLLTKSEQT